ncbi:lipopolysaccharide biosynthesis protein [Geoalkalibacter halelectricus]|uniref:Lipopolysaccharide biosynthesis protein n=1 Tax=Geoalkalibacter halelectricus TaxID=2847045 RepID=A0ABY5ZJF2_9BACT|nr:lipopolysaccharide biosynthesis protein [Geoalkalibacter halelectricus]MDO3379728.1 lipopolysaccharide biosynthesis protein [Geoalkalibacter halelectricus]UWZ79262.1 lipopolysaccharide biosynthesis protein [Geoalkalibacter halelectricus]
MAKDYSKIFDTKHLNKDLKKRSLRSGAVTMSSQGAKFVIQIGSTMILARILTPDDYGMMAMVVAITGFAGLFINLGLSTAVVQRAEINHAQVSTLFWINAGIGVLVTLIVASISPFVAWFYKVPELSAIVLALSLNFFINGLGVQHQALLNRQMRFVAIAVIQVVAMLSGIGVAIFAAVKGFGYWSLVFNSLTASVVMVGGGWIASRWRPGLPKRDAGVGEMLRFGSDIVGFNIINYFSRNLDNVLIGRYHGSGALGFYSKAYQLLMMPITNLRDPLNKVAIPTLSRLQNEPMQYRNYYLKLLSILAFLSIPLVTFMFVCSDRIISLVLGSQWIATSNLFKILAVAGLIQTVSGTRGLVLLTSGKSRKYLYLGAAIAVVTCLAFIIGVPWGATGVASAYAISNFLVLYPSLVYSFQGTPVQVRDFFMTIYKPLAAGIGMGLVCFYLLRVLDNFSDPISLLICLVVSVATYLLAFTVISGGAKDLREFYSYGRLIFAKN